MADKTYALTTTTRIKNQLNITASTWDTVIKRYIYTATDFIEKQTKRKFERTTYTEKVYNGKTVNEKEQLYLIVEAPIISISKLEYDNGSVGSPNWVEFNSTDYESVNDMGLIRIYNKVPKGLQNIRITYVAGYLIDFDNEFDDALHTLPYDITSLCERLVTRLFKKRESEGRDSESFEVSNVQWSVNMLDDMDKKILDSYNRNIAI